LDISLGDLSGFDVVRRLRDRPSRAKIIFLSIHEDVEFVTAGFDIGACGYVFKSGVVEDLRKAIEIVHAGRFVSPTSLHSVTHFLLTIALGLMSVSSSTRLKRPAVQSCARQIGHIASCSMYAIRISTSLRAPRLVPYHEPSKKLRPHSSVYQSERMRFCFLNCKNVRSVGEIWLPRLFTMQARAKAPTAKKKTLAPSRDSRRRRDGFLMILEDRSS
jgi:CheY-like chemotaxis protein